MTRVINVGTILGQEKLFIYKSRGHNFHKKSNNPLILHEVLYECLVQRVYLVSYLNRRGCLFMYIYGVLQLFKGGTSPKKEKKKKKQFHGKNQRVR